MPNDVSTTAQDKVIQDVLEKLSSINEFLAIRLHLEAILNPTKNTLQASKDRLLSMAIRGLKTALDRSANYRVQIEHTALIKSVIAELEGLSREAPANG